MLWAALDCSALLWASVKVGWGLYGKEQKRLGKLKYVGFEGFAEVKVGWVWRDCCN